MKRSQTFRFLPFFLIPVLFLGIWYTCYYREAKQQQQLIDNLYGGRYFVQVDYQSPSVLSSITLSSSGSLWPRKDTNGEIYVREAPPFITENKVPYDIDHFLLISNDDTAGFFFSFVESPSPDKIILRRWHRSQQGSTGSFENAELVDFTLYSSSPDLYYVTSIDDQYIYSICAFWGNYYGEYAFLASAQISDQSWWESTSVLS